MKKTLALVMVLVLALAFVACGGNGSETTVPSTAPTTEPTTVPTTEPTTEPTTVPTTEPAPTASVGGIDLTGMTLEDAKAALTEAAASYKLSLTVNGKPLAFTAEELGLKLDDAALTALLEAAANGTEGSDAVFTYDRDALKGKLKGALNTAPKNATVSYDSSKGKFVASNGTNGTEYQLDAALDAAAASIANLTASAEAEVKTTAIAPELTASSDKVKKAVSTANGYLNVSLTYTYSPEGGSESKESIGVSTVASFIKVNEKMEVSVSQKIKPEFCFVKPNRTAGSGNGASDSCHRFRFLYLKSQISRIVCLAVHRKAIDGIPIIRRDICPEAAVSGRQQSIPKCHSILQIPIAGIAACQKYHQCQKTENPFQI